MKKIIITISVLLISTITVFMSFNYKEKHDPNTYYKVYLQGEVIGIIESKEELEDYIDKQNVIYKEKYKVDKVFVPNGLQIKKITTFSKEIDDVKKVYKKILNKEEFTIPGYQFNLKNNDKTTTIYVTNKQTFDDAIKTTMKTFIGVDNYNLYSEGEQKKITTTGKIIEDIYIQENITSKQVNIAVNELIYTESAELSKFLVFGTNQKTSSYTVKIGDTIEEVAFNNQINIEEFLISNTNFTNEKNLLFPGQQVTIAVTDPQISVISSEYLIEDKEVKYQTNYQYDANTVIGNDKILQTGENGAERVSQKITSVNGNIINVDTTNREELKPMINQIILKGEKQNNGIGGLSNWLWPTNNGYRIMSGYEARINPFTKVRETHRALDISGVGKGSPIYAVTNGVVSESTYRTQDGNYVCLNHNNGYYTCYAHMNKRNVNAGQTVSRGEIIGYVGETGYATGPHLHFEIWKGKPWNGSETRINPWTMYK